MRLIRRLPWLLAFAGAPLTAQIVTPKSVPVHQGDQFDFLPSSRSGMANVWIALDDSLLDPFANPAKVTRQRVSAVFALPYFHSISGGRGGGKTMPVGGFFASGPWSGAVSVAVQQLDRANQFFGTPLSERTALNQYATGVIGRQFSRGLSVGLAAHVAGLGAVDGVDLMYAGSDTIRQDGSAADIRLGLTKQWEGNRTFELVAVHNRTSMTHDVHTTFWGFRHGPIGPATPVSTWDHNEDKTHIWGLHTEYVRPVGTEGWRMGWLATANRLSHPKIPNFRLMNIPRDPGNTNAFNLGLGFGRVAGGATFGVDFIYEPIFSETWADAARDTAIVGGGTIPAGGRTVENTFRFTNTKMRLGISRERASRRNPTTVSGFQFGLALGTVNYRLKQRDNVQRTNRVQNEHWMEWAPTFGYRYASREFEVLYNVRMTCLSGSECLPNFGGDDVSISAPAPVQGGGVIVAPSPLTFDGGRATVHRITVRLPIR